MIAKLLTYASPRTFDDCQPADLRLPTDLLMIGFRISICIIVLSHLSTPITCTMAPVKCYYHDCMNTNATKSMFTFPINDELRLKMWIKHSGNATLASLTYEELKHRFICEDHFDAKDVVKGTSRSRLVPKAVPIMYNPVTSQCLEKSSPETLKVKTPTKVYKRKNIDLPTEEDPSPSTSMIDAPLHTKHVHKRRRLFDNKEDSEVQLLKKQVAHLQQMNKDQRAKIRRLSLKGSNKKKRMILLESFRFTTKASKTIAEMQFRGKNSRKKWTKTEKELCLSIYFKSPATYIHMRRLGIVLAGPSTIRKWLGKTNCLPGLQRDVFKNIEKCFENVSLRNKSCVLSFDEMSIMTSLEYSKKYDRIEGFQDFGKFDRMGVVAKYVLVFLIRGIYSGWKLPVAYFLSAGNVTATKLTFLIKAVLTKLFDAGLLPKAMVSDQISTNQKALKNLGVTPQSPFFFCNGKKIFAFFDVPHALKNIRNNFLNNDLTDGDKIFSFSDVTTTYELDRKNKSKALPKLTPEHLNPNNFQKMKVSLAAQILSRSVAVAIRTVVGTGELKSQTALDTANFIETINNTFDAMNSKSKKSKNPFKCALTKNLNRNRQALLSGKNLLAKLKKILKKKNGSSTLTRPPSFDGFLQSIEAVIQLFKEESSDGIDYLLTSRLNQDVLENLFAIFRLKAGFNKNPSARVLRTIFRSHLVNALMKTSDKKNCKDDDDVFIENTVFNEPAVDKWMDEENEDNEGVADKETLKINEEHNEDEVADEETRNERNEAAEQGTAVSSSSSKLTLEECSVVYFAGYLAKKCIDTHNCSNCIQTLLKDEELSDENQLLILNKIYPSANAPKLNAPSEALFNLVDAALNTFKEHFDNIKHDLNLRNKMYNCFTQNNPQKSNICEVHEKYIIYHLFLVKIYDYCKSHKKNILVNKMNSKLRILKNL